MNTNPQQPDLTDLPPDVTRSPGGKFGFLRALVGKVSILAACTAVGLAAGLAWNFGIPRTDEPAAVIPETIQHKQGLTADEKQRIDALRHDVERNLESFKRTSTFLLDGEHSGSATVVHQSENFSEALVEAQRRTLESRALIVSLQSAMAKGSSLQPFLQQLAVDSSLRESSLEPVEPKPAKRDILLVGHRDTAAIKTKAAYSPELGRSLLEFANQRLRQAGALEETLRQLDDALKTEAVAVDRQATQIAAFEASWGQLLAAYDAAFDKLATASVESNSSSDGGPPVLETVSAVPPVVRTSDVAIRGASLGLIAGMLLIIPRGRLGGRTNAMAVLQQKLGLRLLAEIVKLKPISGRGLDAVVTFAHEGQIESKPFLALRGSLILSSNNVQRLMMTSTDRGDGKTTIASNLAVAFAQAGRKTLLIDADVRSAGTTRLFALRRSRGLTQILREEKPINQSCLENVFNLGVENLDVMPAGPVPFDLPRLLTSERFNELMAWAASIYDQILIDAPCPFFVEDIKSIGRFVDGAALIVRPDKNRRKAILRAINSCRADGINFVGFVANHTRSVIRSKSIEQRSPESEATGANTVVDDDVKPRLAV